MKLFKKGETGKNKKEQKTAEKQQPDIHPVHAAFEKNLKFLNQVTYPISFFQSFWNGSFGTEAFTVGESDFPTGKVVLADPLSYLGSKYQTVLERTVPKGSYPVEISILRSPIAGLRIAAARLRMKETQAVEYKLAMPDGHSEEDINKPGVFSFFGVDAGMGCFADKELAEEFAEFSVGWHAANKDKNIYDDYFMERFVESYRKFPDKQTSYGDFLLWSFPGSGHRLAMFSSGLGDGIYSGYWGVDKSGEITELVVPFMNPEFFV